MVCPLLVTRNASDKLSRTKARGLGGSRAWASCSQLLDRALKPIVASAAGVLPSPRGKAQRPERIMIRDGGKEQRREGQTNVLEH